MDGEGVISEERRACIDTLTPQALFFNGITSLDKDRSWKTRITNARSTTESVSNSTGPREKGH